MLKKSHPEVVKYYSLEQKELPEIVFQQQLQAVACLMLTIDGWVAC